MFGERRAAEANRLPADFENGGLARLDVRDRARNHVRVQIAVREVPPDGSVESAPGEFVVAVPPRCSDTTEQMYHIASRVRYLRSR